MKQIVENGYEEDQATGRNEVDQKAAQLPQLMSPCTSNESLKRSKTMMIKSPQELKTSNNFFMQKSKKLGDKIKSGIDQSSRMKDLGLTSMFSQAKQHKVSDFKDMCTAETSGELLQSMSFPVDVSCLYNIISTCISNEANKYCPVLLQVADQKLIQCYDGEYIIQLWTTNKKLIFQRIRSKPVTSWNIIGDVFVFLEDQKLNQGQKFVADLFNMGDEIQSYMVCKIANDESFQIWRVIITVDSGENLPGEMCCFWNGHFLIASKDTLHYINLTQQFENSKSQISRLKIATAFNKNEAFSTIRLNSSQFKKIRMKTGWKIRDIKEIMPVGECVLVCENTSDAKITFFQIKELTKGPPTLQPLSQITEKREGIPNDDHIVRFDSLMCYQEDMKEYKQCGIALRKSGCVDFYYDFRLIESQEKTEERVFTEIGADFAALHFKCFEKEKGKVTKRQVTYECLTSWKQRLGFYSSKQKESKPVIVTVKPDDEDEKYEFEHVEGEEADHLEKKIVGKKVSQHVQLYSSFINDGRKFMLAHNHIVSIFHLRKLQWTAHTQFSEGQVRQIFRNRRMAHPIDGQADQSDFDVGILVGDSTFHFFEFKDLGKIKLDRDKKIKIDGKILNFAVDQQHDTGFYFTVKTRVEELPDINNLTNQSHWDERKSETRLKILVDKKVSDITPPIFFEKYNDYCITMQYTDVEREENTFGIVLDAYDEASKDQQEQLQMQLREEEDGVVNLFSEPKSMKIDYSEIFKKLGKSSEGQGNWPYGKIVGDIQNQMLTIRITTKHILILDQYNTIKYIFENRNILSIIYVDQNWVYALKNSAIGYDNNLKKPGGQFMESGLYVYDFSRLLQGQLEVHQLNEALAGAYSFIDFDDVTQTISFLKNYQEIVMMPLPHRNTIKFFGMGMKSDYLIWRQQDGTFTALDKKLNVTMWSNVTGKIMKSQSIEQCRIEEEKSITKDGHEDTAPNNTAKRIAVAMLGIIPVEEQQVADLSKARRNEFQVYKANSRDKTYLSNWNNYSDYSLSLLVSLKPVKAANQMSSLTCSQEDSQAVCDPRIKAKTSVFESNNATEISSKTRQKCQIYKFKILKMGDDTQIEKSQSKSFVSMQIGTKRREILWKEVGNFEFLVQKSPDDRPYIYINKDYTKMLVHYQKDFSAIVYKNDGIAFNKAISWKIKHIIHRYPVMLKGTSSANFLFSPSFDRFIDIDFNASIFVIRKSSDSNIIGRIPIGMISISFKGRDKSEEAIQSLASRISFLNEDEIRIITKEGLDCIYNYVNGRLQSAVSIDNFDGEDFSDPHAILEQTQLDNHLQGTLKRLMRRCNKIKQTVGHEYKQLKVKKMAPKKIKNQLVETTYKNMFSVDYDETDFFSLELSFTCLDWMLMERIVEDKTYSFRNVDEFQRLQMCFNIFPRIRSIWHYLAENQSHCDIDLLQKIFDQAKSGVEILEGKRVYLPIFKDQEGNTPLDACLDTSKHLNLKLVEFLFKNIMEYPILHSSHLLQRAVCSAIAQGVPTVVDFLRERMIKSPQLTVQRMQSSEIQQSKKEEANGYFYHAQLFPIWADKSKVAAEMFETNATRFSEKLSLCFFDIPDIADASQKSDKFFNYLADSDDLDLFGETIVQIIIQRAWKEVKVIYWLFLFCPYLLLLVLWVTWKNILTTKFDEQTFFSEKDKQEYYATTVSQMIIGVCIFILCQETMQLKSGFLNYIQDKWNWIDLSSTIAAGTGPILYLWYNHLFDEENDSHQEILNNIRVYASVTASMFLWIKFLYFFRTKERFGYLIRMIVEVFSDIMPFLLAFFVVIIAFSDAFYSQSNSRKKDERYLPDFFTSMVNTYQIALGEFTMMDDFKDDISAWVLFLLCTIFNLIVMLNLLIAIISDSYERVNTTKEKVAMKELANLVLDLRHFTCFRKLMKNTQPCEFLFIAITSGQKQDDYVDMHEVNDTIQKMKKQQMETNKIIDMINEKITANAKSFASLSQVIETKRPYQKGDDAIEDTDEAKNYLMATIGANMLATKLTNLALKKN